LIGAGSSYVAYCFAPVAGYSSFGSYTGNGSEGPFVYTGFAPRFIIIKGITTSTAFRSWCLIDTSRPGYNPTYSNFLYANRSVAEGFRGDGATATGVGLNVDILSNGFRPTGGGQEVSEAGQEYIYVAFAEHPFATARAR
jgi:hypothetical protein